MDKQVIFLIAVIALVVLAGVQAVQISDVKGVVQGGAIVSAGAGDSGNSQQVVQAPVQQQPAMVGGC